MRANCVLTFALATAVSTTVIPELARRGGSVWITPHDKYSSSIGALGCMIDSNHVAYWPETVSCDDLCRKISIEDRHVTVLHIDESDKNFDISYDAWNYLTTGQSARDYPTTGGPTSATWESVPMSECADILSKAGGKLPLTATNSLSYLGPCGPETWARKNYDLINAADTQCRWGYNDTCSLVNEAPICPSTKLGEYVDSLGIPIAFPGGPVIDLAYGTGKDSPAL